jgi:hypothetical protein
MISTVGRFVSLMLFLVTASCSADGTATQSHATPGPVTLKNAEHMGSFLATGKFSRVGNDTDWWVFLADGTFTAHLAEEDVQGQWSATTTNLKLTKVQVAGDSKTVAAAGDRSLDLEWQDGKLNINIGGHQYRLYN